MSYKPGVARKNYYDMSVENKRIRPYKLLQKGKILTECRSGREKLNRNSVPGRSGSNPSLATANNSFLTVIP